VASKKRGIGIMGQRVRVAADSVAATPRPVWTPPDMARETKKAKKTKGA
jgi:hypothetical protein